ncbi:MAG: tail protein X [Campylobacter sp.]|jgi:phage tail protein X|nr:tail protein X [Campylobacter sp.]
MDSYIAKENEKLDIICYKHYKTLAVFNIFLRHNTHLTNKPLKAGDIVYLPKITIESKKAVKQLWD